LNSLHQLGFPSTTSCSSGECTTTPTRVPGLENVRQIALGSAHACALHGDGTVDCWGASDEGQTAAPSSSWIACGKLSLRRCVPTPTKVAELTGAVQLALGGAHSCARLEDGTVKCWGANRSRQLGTDAMDDCGGFPCARTPLSIPGLTNVQAIAATGEHTCALLADGTAKCWGDNPEGLLGFTSTEMCVVGPCAPKPTRVPGESDIQQISLGFVTCVLHTDRTFRCWGYNCDGELGNGTFGGCPMP
jgi:alpha-tubulin suppressor-like RCC1 family protein